MSQSQYSGAIGSSDDNPINIVDDQTGSPTFVDDLARFLWKLCSQKQWAAIYHWCDAGTCTWYEFAQAIKQHGTTIGLLQQPIYLRPVTSKQYGSTVNRPPFSALNSQQSQSIAIAKPWRQSLSLCINERLLSKDDLSINKA